MASRESEFADEFALSSAVPFPEWMNSIDLAKEVSRAMNPGRSTQIFQEILMRKLGKQSVEVLPQKLRRREDCVCLRDVHGAQFSRPRIYILKDMPMNSTQMFGVELAASRFSLKLQ
ncbi:MAG TPA: hypothetical protein VGR47_08180 [Terracidiphilus sp.]|nr:hypothetical protein [Terracidiphilus sp.]